MAFHDSGYLEIDERLRIGLPEAVRLDAQGAPRPRDQVVRPCVAPPVAATEALGLVDEVLPRGRCAAHLDAPVSGTGVFVRIYVDTTAAPETVLAFLRDRVAVAAARAGAVEVQVAPLTHGAWTGARARWDTRRGDARATAEADFVVIPRIGGGSFVVASSGFDPTRLELSQRRP